MKKFLLTILIVTSFCFAAKSSQLSDDIIALQKAGVSNNVIVAYIQSQTNTNIIISPSSFSTNMISSPLLYPMVAVPVMIDVEGYSLFSQLLYRRAISMNHISYIVSNIQCNTITTYQDHNNDFPILTTFTTFR